MALPQRSAALFQSVEGELAPPGSAALGLVLKIAAYHGRIACIVSSQLDPITDPLGLGIVVVTWKVPEVLPSIAIGLG